MGHTDVDFLDAHLAAIFDHRLERGHCAFAAVEAEALRADIFLGEEFLPLLGVDDLGKDRLLALGVNWTVFLAPSIRSWRKRRSSTSLMCMYSKPMCPQ